MKTSTRSAKLLWSLGAIVASASLAQAASTAKTQPLWAFFAPDATQPPAGPADDAPKSVPGSNIKHTMAEIDDLKNPPDWFPDQHAPMPRVVAKGGEGNVLACVACHLTSGMGHPQSAPLAGMSRSYFERQIAEFKSGARRNPIVENGKPVVNAPEYMVMIARELTEEDARAASEWFARLKPRPWVKVVESRTVPRTYITRGFSRSVWPGGGEEPLGNRIIELPQDAERAALRDPRVGTLAHVPVGSLERGRRLVTTGDGKTVQCGSCHGQDLKGVADIPAIAGASPTYAFRQLYSYKDGSRNGSMASLMKHVVENLDESDMIAIAAYTATLPN